MNRLAIEKACLKLKRIYELPDPSDGIRILVDRLWPRGIRKADASIDLWLKEIAPSPDLRKWFSHDPKRFEEFRVYYQMQLEQEQSQCEAVKQLLGCVNSGSVTLLFAAKDLVYNHAVVLRDFIENRLQQEVKNLDEQLSGSQSDCEDV